MTDDKFWKTALAVALGFVIAGAIGYLVRLWMINQALSDFHNAQ